MAQDSWFSTKQHRFESGWGRQIMDNKYNKIIEAAQAGGKQILDILKFWYFEKRVEKSNPLRFHLGGLEGSRLR